MGGAGQRHALKCAKRGNPQIASQGEPQVGNQADRLLALVGRAPEPLTAAEHYQLNSGLIRLLNVSAADNRRQAEENDGSLLHSSTSNAD